MPGYDRLWRGCAERIGRSRDRRSRGADRARADGAGPARGRGRSMARTGALRKVRRPERRARTRAQLEQGLPVWRKEGSAAFLPGRRRPRSPHDPRRARRLRAYRGRGAQSRAWYRLRRAEEGYAAHRVAGARQDAPDGGPRPSARRPRPGRRVLQCRALGLAPPGLLLRFRRRDGRSSSRWPHTR